MSITIMESPYRIANFQVSVAGLEAVLFHLPAGVMALDQADRICMCNPAAVRMLGLEIDALLGKEFCAILSQADLSDAVVTSRKSGAAINTRQIALEVQGQKRLISVTVQPVDEESNRPIRRFVYLSDVTSAARAAQVETDFVANASHELRTPLATMKAAAETLLESADRLDANQCRFVQLLAKNVDRLEELAQDLLDLARIESANLPVAIESVALQPILDEIERDRQNVLEDSGATMTRELDCPVVRGDRRLLKRILGNLLDNAFKFVAPGQGRIVVRSSISGGWQVVEVQDNGAGIAEEDRNRVFERFFQSDRARTETGPAGTGLGLAIARQAATAMGGTLELDDALETGTLIRLQIPLP